MLTSRTTTTTIPQPRASTSSCPADPPSTGIPADEDEDSIVNDALARVERVKMRKAEEARKQAEEEAAARRAVEEEQRRKDAAAWASVARKKAVQEQQHAEVVERQQLLWRPQQRGVSRALHPVMCRSPLRGRWWKFEGREKVQTQPVGGDPDDSDDEEREPCERCKAKKIPCLQLAGKWRRPSMGKQEGTSDEQMTVMESQMARSLANLWALPETNTKSHQYLCQLLRQQEDNHA
ncbi:hypothetical protein GG344DRAFT_77116 [Lentinula edodes]|nr:hypothetical protein GG344DRAFT_77116 [Lentinula edodes]